MDCSRNDENGHDREPTDDAADLPKKTGLATDANAVAKKEQAGRDAKRESNEELDEGAACGVETADGACEVELGEERLRRGVGDVEEKRIGTAVGASAAAGEGFAAVGADLEHAEIVARRRKGLKREKGILFLRLCSLAALRRKPLRLRTTARRGQTNGP